MVKRGIFAVIIFLLLISTVGAVVVDPHVEEVLNRDSSVKVIVKLKDMDVFAKGKAMSISEKRDFLEQRREYNKDKQDEVLERLGKGGKLGVAEADSGFQLGHRYSVTNGFSGKIDRATLEKLKNDPDVEAIQFDYPVHAFLDTSVPQINGTAAWGLQLNSVNITGAGETICIVDTGINYQHPALGGCNITRINLTGNTESYVLESAHPYSDLTLYNWTITKPGYTNIALHFKNYSIEPGYDQLRIYDSNWKEIAAYSGSNTDVWSTYAAGDTLHILWQTDENTNGYGFYIDQVINGTTNTTYDWSNCTKVIGGWDFVNSDGNPMDDHSHGTHCAGIAASTDSTYRGVAPGANLIAVKVLNSGGGGTDSDVAAGVDWCINRSADYNISVISLSLGCVDSPPFYCTHWQTNCDASAETAYSVTAMNTAFANNIFVAVAAGNQGWTDGISSPACVSGAVPVGGVDASDGIIYNRGNLLSLLAPATSITSTVLGTSFGNKSGTSMATPHVAGAAALMKQFMRLWNDTTLTTTEMVSVLNRTGKIVYDSSSGKNYSRINVYGALISQDDISPIVQFINPMTNLTTSNYSIVINVSVNETLAVNSCILNWNGTNQSMTKVGSGEDTSCYINITVTSLGTYYLQAYAIDLNANLGLTEVMQITINNTAPNITSYYPPSQDFSIIEPNNQTFNISYSDPDNDSSIQWYLDGTLVSNTNNYAFYGNFSAAGTYNLTVIISDYFHSTSMSWNMVINDTDTAPVLQPISAVTVNESETINITVNASDIDNTTLIYASNNSRLIQNGNNFVWVTNLTDAGIYSVRINVTDGLDWDYEDVSITIIDATDFDGDGNPDFNDTDDDNDGVADSTDTLAGNVTNINSTVAVQLILNGSSNTSQAFTGAVVVNITTSNNESIVDFNWNFSKATLTVNWTIDYNATAGTLRIQGLDLSSQGVRKTAYINKSDSAYNYICIADDESTATVSLDTSCTGYTKVSCTGTSGQYTCTDLGDKFKIEGLDHSAVRGITYSAPYTPSGGGGGGGSSTTKVVCEEVWSCGDWSECINSYQTRSCTDLNNCGTVSLKPSDEQSCFVDMGQEIQEVGVVEETAILPESVTSESASNETGEKSGILGHSPMNRISAPIVIIILLIFISVAFIIHIIIK